MPNTTGSPYNICYIEDSRTAAHPVKKFLKGLSQFEFEHFLNAEDAHDALTKKSFDILITDLTLSSTGMNGQELIRKIRAESTAFKNIPILVTTGSTSEAVLIDVFNAGANDYLMKPVNLVELENRMLNHAMTRNKGEVSEVASGKTKGKICLIEDSRTAALFLKREIKDAGYEIEHHLNAEDGLKSIETAEYDVVLSDMNLDATGMDGDELVRTLRKHNDEIIARIPCIIITGDTTGEAIKRVYDSGANDYLAKPVKARELIVRIENMIALYREIISGLKTGVVADDDQPSPTVVQQPEPVIEAVKELSEEEKAADDLLSGVDFGDLSFDDEIIEENKVLETPVQKQVVEASKDIQIEVPKEIQIETPEEIQIKSQEEIQIEAPGSFIQDGTDADEEMTTLTLDDIPEEVIEEEPSLELVLDLEEESIHELPKEKPVKKVTIPESKVNEEVVDEAFNLSDLEIDEAGIDDFLEKVRSKPKCVTQPKSSGRKTDPASEIPLKGMQQGNEVLSVMPLGSTMDEPAPPQFTQQSAPQVKKKSAGKKQANNSNSRSKSELPPDVNLKIQSAGIVSRFFGIIGKIVKLVIILGIIGAVVVGGLVGMKKFNADFELPFEIPVISELLENLEVEDEDESQNQTQKKVKSRLKSSVKTNDYEQPSSEQSFDYEDDEMTTNQEVKPEPVIEKIRKRSAASIEGAGLSDSQKGLAIAEENHNRNLGYVDETAQVIMSVTSKHGDTIEHVFDYSSMESMGEEKSLYKVTQSPDIKGTALLVHNHDSQADEQWLYIPAIKRIAQINDTNRASSFAGSEFSYEDLTSHAIDKYDYKWIRNDSYGGIPCFVIEAYPKQPYSGYSKEERWIDKQQFRNMKINYFDKSSHLLKTLTVGKYRSFRNNMWRPGNLKMKNHATGKVTTIAWDKNHFGNGLSDQDFDMQSMQRE